MGQKSRVSGEHVLARNDISVAMLQEEGCILIVKLLEYVNLGKWYQDVRDSRREYGERVNAAKAILAKEFSMYLRHTEVFSRERKEERLEAISTTFAAMLHREVDSECTRT